MNLGTGRFARIRATGMHLPQREISNDTLRQRFPGTETIDKLEAATGIRRRWYAPEDWATSDLALAAARDALKRAEMEPEELDLIVLGTDSPDYLTPATSVVLQHKLGARNAGTFDVGCACASFPTGLAAAAGILATHRGIGKALVVGAYLMERLADPQDPTIFFYGDGAGAAVLEAGEEPGFLGSAFQADGVYAPHWGIFAGATAEPATAEAVAAGRTQVRFIERYPPEINNEGWPRLVRRLARDTGFALEDIDCAIFTQVRKSSIELVMENLGLPQEKAHMIMADWGYTGSACVPMALHDAVQKGKIQRGDLVVMVGSGVGYNQAAAAFRMV